MSHWYDPRRALSLFGSNPNSKPAIGGWRWTWRALHLVIPITVVGLGLIGAYHPPKFPGAEDFLGKWQRGEHTALADITINGRTLYRKTGDRFSLDVGTSSYGRLLDHKLLGLETETWTFFRAPGISHYSESTPIYTGSAYSQWMTKPAAIPWISP